MKKDSKTIRKDYTLLDQSYSYDKLEYYGILLKNKRVRLDTKRYRKFFDLPDEKIEHRQTVYYTPSRVHRYDYRCNVFVDILRKYKERWFNEYKSFFECIKTPEEVGESVRLYNLNCGYEDYEEASISGLMAQMKRVNEYNFIIRSIYAQFYHHLMSSIDAMSLKLMVDCGYKDDDFTKKQFDAFIQGKQGKNAVPFKQYKYFRVYDRANTVWNFLKHNSTKSYTIVKKYYPEMIVDPNNKYKNGDSALSVLRLDEKFIVDVLNNLHKFFGELCERTFGENPQDADWDYDDYFIKQAKDAIRNIENPLDL